MLTTCNANGDIDLACVAITISHIALSNATDILTTGIGAASCERSFSKLKPIKIT